MCVCVCVCICVCKCVFEPDFEVEWCVTFINPHAFQSAAIFLPCDILQQKVRCLCGLTQHTKVYPTQPNLPSVSQPEFLSTLSLLSSHVSFLSLSVAVHCLLCVRRRVQRTSGGEQRKLLLHFCSLHFHA